MCISNRRKGQERHWWDLVKSAHRRWGGGSEGSSGSVQKNSRQIRSLWYSFSLLAIGGNSILYWELILFLLRWIIYWFFSSRRRTLHAVASSDIWNLWNISMIGMPVKGMLRAIVLAVIKLQTCTTDGAGSEFPQTLRGQNFCIQYVCMVRSSSSWCGLQVIQAYVKFHQIEKNLSL